MLLEELILNIDSISILGNLQIEIKGIEFDSRKIQKNYLFIANKGTSVDGHNYIDSAIKNGATAIICEDVPQKINKNICYIQVKNSSEVLGQIAAVWYNNPSERLKLIGITGTNGKTTIATLLYELFKAMGHKVGLISTVCNYVDEEKIKATHTTPDALTINHLLNQMVETGCSYTFMEVSSHALEQNRVSGLYFHGGVFTNLTRDHMDYHHTFDNYLKAKKLFFDILPAESFALINIDDKNGKIMVQNSQAMQFSYSMRGLADFKTKILEHSFDGMLLNINNHEIYVPFIGKFNAQNLCAVYATSILLSTDELETLQILSSLTPVSGRFETLRSPTGYTAIVDYAHTPDALNNVITTINQILQKNGRLITVVGCGGNRDKGKRPIMAREAVNGSWKAIFTSDNPRFEDPIAIIQDMIDGLDEKQKTKYISIVDRREAIKTACLLAQSGDVILIAGKGHENYQIIQGKKHHFNDKEEVQKHFSQTN